MPDTIPPGDTGTIALVQMVQGLIMQVSHQASDVALIKRDTEENKADVRALTKILRDGNGQPPLMVRLALVESAFKDQVASLQSIKESLEKRSLEETKGKWSVVVSVITGIMSLMALIFTTYLSFIKH